MKEYLSITEVATLLGVHRTTALRLMKADGVPLLKLGKGFRVRKVDVDNFLEGRTEAL
jgi:excisionase family DNA binding protein